MRASPIVPWRQRRALHQAWCSTTFRRWTTSSGRDSPILRTNCASSLQALESRADEPLRALWEFSRGEATGALMTEFMALGNHRKSIRTEIAEVTERVRKVQLDALVAKFGKNAKPGWTFLVACSAVVDFGTTEVPEPRGGDRGQDRAQGSDRRLRAVSGLDRANPKSRNVNPRNGAHVMTRTR